MSNSIFYRAAVIAVISIIFSIYVGISIFLLSSCSYTAPSPGPYDPCHQNCVKIINQCQVNYDIHFCNREFEMCMNDCSE